MLFGVNVSTSAAAGADPVADALMAEEFGFDFVSASDHPSGNHPTYETWTMLCSIAAKTTRIKVASRVLGVPYRPPAMVAKMAESLDRLSKGRLILGLGGGASDHEFQAFGLRVPSPRDKVTGLEEAIRIIRGLWTESRFTYAGSQYSTEAAELEPKPAHRIPLWLGTFGQRALAVTGRVGDGWIPSFDLAPPDQVPAMRAVIDSAAQAAGREPRAITSVYNIDVRVGENRDDGPGVVSGSSEAIVERLAGFVKLGFTAMNFVPKGAAQDEQIEQLGREIIPAIRSA